MIHIQKLSKSFAGHHVLQNINLDINEGCIYGIAGRSGAGKSTLLRCINGLERFDRGSLVVDGIELKDLPEQDMAGLRSNIGMIFQQFALIERISVRKNIALPMKWKNSSKDATNRRVEELLRLVGMPEKIDEKVRNLSGGQKQRVAIARALTLNPQILLCDEATSSLDPRTADSILTLLKDINRKLGITIVLVTHQMDALRTTCHRLAILEDGVLKEEGSTREVFLRQSKVLRNLIGEQETRALDSAANFQLVLEGDQMNEPIAAHLARDLALDFTIEKCEVEQFYDGDVMLMSIAVPPEKEGSVRKYLDQKNIQYLRRPQEKEA